MTAAVKKQPSSGDFYMRLGEIIQGQKAMHSRLDGLEEELKVNTATTAAVKASCEALSAEVREPLQAWKDASGGVRVLGWISKVAGLVAATVAAIAGVYYYVKGIH